MNGRHRSWLLLALVSVTGFGFSFATPGGPPGDDTDAGDRLRKELKDEVADFWIYEDLEAGFSRARETGRPLLVSIRCVP